MALGVVGTPQDISSGVGGSATPAPFNVTVETGSNLVALMWAQWPNGAPGAGTMNASSTLNGVTADVTSIQSGEGGADESATGAFLWYGVAAGTRELDVNWDDAPSEGPVAALVCVSDADTTTGPSDSATDSTSGTASVTLANTAADDLVLKFAQNYNTAPTAAGGSWTSLVSGTNNSEGFRAESLVATGASTVCPSGGSFYSSVVAFSIAAAGATAYELIAGAGSYSLSGTAVALAHNRSLTAEAGAYSISGTAAGLVPEFLVSAEGGAYSITGGAAGLEAGFLLTAEGGAYTITGASAGLAPAYALTAEAGTYAITGADATLDYGGNTTLSAEAGSYAISGAAASLIGDFALGAESGAYAITGAAAGLLVTSAISAEAGSYTIAGASAGLEAGLIVSAEGGSYSLSGAEAGLDIGSQMAAEAGSYSITGAEVSLTFGGVIEGSGSLVSGDSSMSGTGTKGGLIIGYVTRDEEYVTPVPLWPVEGFGSLRSGHSTMQGTGEVTWADYNVRVLLMLAA